MNRIRKAMREPLLHFLFIGAGLFFLFSSINGPVDDKPNRIVVTPGQVELLAANFTRTWMRPPTEQEMEGLIKSYLRDEVYYREAIALGLDKDDAFIRRRMRQKLEFILEDITAQIDPTEDELRAYMLDHRKSFWLEPQVSFRQLYLNPDQRHDIEGDAENMLAQLHAGENPEELGDLTMTAYEFGLTYQSEIAKRFGDKFAREILNLGPGKWTGPVYSGLGEHLVMVSERIEGRLPELSEVRSDVEREWLIERRRELEDATYNRLLEEYEVVMEAPPKPDYGLGTAVAATLDEAGAR